MNSQFLSRFDADNLRKAVIYFAISLPLIIISLVLGIEKNGWTTFMFFLGVPFFFMQCYVLGEMQNIMGLCVYSSYL